MFTGQCFEPNTEGVAGNQGFPNWRSCWCTGPRPSGCTHEVCLPRLWVTIRRKQWSSSLVAWKGICCWWCWKYHASSFRYKTSINDLMNIHRFFKSSNYAINFSYTYHSTRMYEWLSERRGSIYIWKYWWNLLTL